MAKDTRITSREENYSEWYTDVIRAAELIDQGSVRGSMVFRPYGYAIWELIQKYLDARIKDTGHSNVYFPLLIPKSLLAREAQHVAGFALESAVVTHHRLKVENGELIVDPDAKLPEELIIRPTSEAIMYETFSHWITSWRDLPLLVNQWANVMRWEMRTRPFLRTSEFLWQEGHTAHATEQEARDEQMKMLLEYEDFMKHMLAISPVSGEKTESERFAGAQSTFTLEAYMQDGKALQACTSHHLGQNFSKVFNITFTDANEEKKHVWQTSWGMTTRIIGAIIMSHGDDKGIVIPPRIAPYQVVLIPIFKAGTEESVLKKTRDYADTLRTQGVRVYIDERDYLSFGERVFEWEKKGVPVRIEIGPRDIDSGTITMVVRDQEQKHTIPEHELISTVQQSLEDLHERLYVRSHSKRVMNTYTVSTWEEFKNKVKEKNGFILANWDGSPETERLIKEETGATIRCIPFEGGAPDGVCIYSGKSGRHKVIFAKNY
jgi:prolyl-tRNA synthetase